MEIFLTYDIHDDDDDGVDHNCKQSTSDENEFSVLSYVNTCTKNTILSALKYNKLLWFQLMYNNNKRQKIKLEKERKIKKQQQQLN